MNDLTAAQIEALLATLVPLPAGYSAEPVDAGVSFDDDADLLDDMIADERSANAFIRA